MTTSLGVGTTASLALVVASLWVPWLVWSAVVAALAGGGLATWAAVRSKREQRTRLLAQARVERLEHREHLRASHAAQREVLGLMDTQSRMLRRDLTQTRTELGEATMENSRLRGDLQSVRSELKTSRDENAQLRDHMVILKLGTNEGAEVLSLPRRRAAEGDEVQWAAGDAPTIIDLDLQRVVIQSMEDFPESKAN